jgi:hypothetical protein
MQRYKKGVRTADHGLEQIFSAYNSTRETEFVQAFFSTEEINSILESCGLETLQNPEPILERPVKIGVNTTKRADLVFENEDQAYYFEVMSQSGAGRWDDDHHQQMLLKTKKLELEYGSDLVYTFAVAFKEFDPIYLDDIQKMDNCYAVHLRFNEHGYFADVYGIEEKSRKTAIKLQTVSEVAQRWLDLAAEHFPNRKNTPRSNRYLDIGKGIQGNKGIEWVISSRGNRIGIKLHGHLYNQYECKSDEILKHIQEQTGILLTSKGTHDQTFWHDMNLEDLSAHNKDQMIQITRAFAEYFDLSFYLE